MITYNLSESDKATRISVSLPLLKGSIKTVLSSWGSGIDEISYIDSESESHLLTLSYQNAFPTMNNPSLAGRTIGPNSGRMKGNTLLHIDENDLAVDIFLSPNEGSSQLHGGKHNLAGINWKYDGVSIDETMNQLTFSFSTSLSAGLEGWPGNRSFRTSYTFSSDGTIDISLTSTSDQNTYINMTNHLYWMRDPIVLNVFSDKYISCNNAFLPIDVCPLEKSMVKERAFCIKKEAVFNNGFLLDCQKRDNSTLIHAASMQHRSGLMIDMYTDAPALVVYTGDYLDNTSLLSDGSVSFPGCAIALEPQELFPVTKATLTIPSVPYKRCIRYSFKSLSP